MEEALKRVAPGELDTSRDGGPTAFTAAAGFSDGGVSRLAAGKNQKPGSAEHNSAGSGRFYS